MSDDPHAAARAMYEDYCARAATLARHRAYADAVVRATSNAGQTPVEPLATLGKGGGPLRCDVCEKPMILEGGEFHGVYADEAWRRNPQPGWVSWMKGGMVVQIESNRTLRVYHGYPGRSGCVLKADRARDQARAEFTARMADVPVSANLAAIRAYLKVAAPDQATDAVMSDVYKVLFVFDPGLGINTLV